MDQQPPYDPPQYPPPGNQGFGGGSANPSQPGPYGSGGYVPQPDVPDYLVWSILTTICCCLPLGVASIVYAVQAKSKKDSGDISGALANAATAKKLMIIGAIAGAVVTLLYILLVVVLGVFSTEATDSIDTY